VGDGDDPLRPVSKLGVGHDEGDDDDEEDKGGGHHVDDERLFKLLGRVLGANVGEAGERGALVEALVKQVGDPLVVGQTGGRNGGRRT
jgi:hypothetical protein